MEISIAVAEKAFDEGTAMVPWGKEEVRKNVERARWHPVYRDYVFDEAGQT